VQFDRIPVWLIWNRQRVNRRNRASESTLISGPTRTTITTEPPHKDVPLPAESFLRLSPERCLHSPCECDWLNRI